MRLRIDETSVIMPYIIGITGGCSAGKKRLAHAIAKELNPTTVTILEMNSFYKELTPQQQELADRNEYNFDTPDAFDIAEMYKCLKSLSEGKSVEVPVYNCRTHLREKNKIVMHAADVIVVEGILTFYDPEILKLLDLKLFVDTDADTRLARRLERETVQHGRSFELVIDQYLRLVKFAYEEFIAGSMKNADVILRDGIDPHEMLTKVVSKICSDVYGQA